ncbi:Late embryogenesis abundant protein, LEA-14 [Gossypium australe]|uniref:Late embryogenesis abundant protein, LEA-14 n=1 Tax=Gossypium australe TaxID=47621 RepID=A0A5B6VJR6_9ROSI|nr:Late embryogenesis abundant protein, LEA-14 [Gossypium australe]
MAPKSKLSTSRERATNPLVWCGAIICIILTIAVIIGGIVTFIGYLVIHPRVPYVSVMDAHLDHIQIDYAGILEIQVTILIRAQNGNEKAHASFSDSSYSLSLNREVVAQLVAPPFEVGKNSSVYFNYVVPSSPIPLRPDQAEDVDAGLKKDLIIFDLKGSSRVRWRIGSLGSVRYLCRLDCQLRFHPLNGTYIPSRWATRISGTSLKPKSSQVCFLGNTRLNAYM